MLFLLHYKNETNAIGNAATAKEWSPPIPELKTPYCVGNEFSISLQNVHGNNVSIQVSNCDVWTENLICDTYRFLRSGAFPNKS